MPFPEVIFREECLAQQVKLNSSVKAPLINECFVSDWRVGYPTGVLGSVVEAAYSLEQHPDRILADKAIDPTNFADDVPSGVLAGLINASLGVEQEKVPHFTVENPVEERDDCCSAYEDMWIRTFDAAKRWSRQKPLMQIFVDEDNEPVLLRKGRGRPTGLLLVDAAIGKKSVVYPAGSAVQISTPQDRYFGSTRITDRKLVMDASATEVLPVSAIDRMSFLRLTPFQVPAAQRATHFDRVSTRATWSYPTVEVVRDLARKGLASRASGRRTIFGVGWSKTSDVHYV